MNSIKSNSNPLEQIKPEISKVDGIRVSGKQWKTSKQPVRSRSIGISKSSWNDKKRQRDALQLAKQKEKQLKEEKEQAQKDRIDALKAKRQAKAEKERYELMAKKMHAKKVERIRRREKRNKLLADGR